MSHESERNPSYLHISAITIEKHEGEIWLQSIAKKMDKKSAHLRYKNSHGFPAYLMRKTADVNMCEGFIYDSIAYLDW